MRCWRRSARRGSRWIRAARTTTMVDLPGSWIRKGTASSCGSRPRKLDPALAQPEHGRNCQDHSQQCDGRREEPAAVAAVAGHRASHVELVDGSLVLGVEGELV